MNLVSLPEDPLFCKIFYDETNKTFMVKERVIDPYEKDGFQETWFTIAEGFETRDKAEDWLNDIRKDFNF